MKTRDDSTRGRLIAIAVELFQDRGYPSVSVQDVVAAAGLTKGAFYYYLQSKEELLYLIHDEFISYELDKAEQLLALGLPPTETLRQMVADLVESIERYKSHVKLFFRDMHFLGGDYLVNIKAKRKTYEHYFLRVIRQGIEQGQFRADLDPKIVTFALFGMCNWTYQWLNPEGPYRADQIAGIFEKLFLNGCLAGAAAPPGAGAGNAEREAE